VPLEVGEPPPPSLTPHGSTNMCRYAPWSTVSTPKGGGQDPYKGEGKTWNVGETWLVEEVWSRD